MSMNERLTNDMKTAMKARDKLALNTIRALKSSIKNTAIEQGGADVVLDDPTIIKIVRKQVKQRLDSIAQFNSAGRSELAENEQAEILILEKYLPQAMSEQEIVALVSQVIAEVGATSRADMGKVMSILQEKTDGCADGKVLSQAVMKALG